MDSMFPRNRPICETWVFWSAHGAIDTRRDVCTIYAITRAHTKGWSCDYSTACRLLFSFFFFFFLNFFFRPLITFACVVPATICIHIRNSVYVQRGVTVAQTCALVRNRNTLAGVIKNSTMEIARNARTTLPVSAPTIVTRTTPYTIVIKLSGETPPYIFDRDPPPPFAIKVNVRFSKHAKICLVPYVVRPTFTNYCFLHRFNVESKTRTIGERGHVNSPKVL
jgi:hypothetical protein